MHIIQCFQKIQAKECFGNETTSMDKLLHTCLSHKYIVVLSIHLQTWRFSVGAGDWGLRARGHAGGQGPPFPTAGARKRGL